MNLEEYMRDKETQEVKWAVYEYDDLVVVVPTVGFHLRLSPACRCRPHWEQLDPGYKPMLVHNLFATDISGQT